MMLRPRTLRWLFLLILVEGYVVLATELLAIRLLIPFVGSGTETVAIVISAVLLPLAAGYHAGSSAFARRWAKERKSIRKLLLSNIFIAACILLPGLSYSFLELFFAFLEECGLHHRLMQTALYALIFLVFPVFTLAQTVPLVTHYLRSQRLSRLTGRILFFSTTGSFLGSVFSTIVLMSYWGVHITVIVTLALLLAVVPMLVRRGEKYEMAAAAFLLGVAYLGNGEAAIARQGIVANNAYNTIAVQEVPQEAAKWLVINRSFSSKIAADPARGLGYIRVIESTFLAPLQQGEGLPREILIIGAGGFSAGLLDTHNHYTYVDIDKDLKRVAEAHFLPKPLSPNKRFVAESARAFVHRDHKQYDFILLDVYTNFISVPMETVTQGFLLDVKRRLKPGGILAANIISEPTFKDRFTRRYDSTFASVFPHYTRQIISPYNPWKPNAQTPVNVLYIYYDSPGIGEKIIYTDDLNSYSRDR